MLAFVKKIFDLWLEDDNPAFRIRNFRNVIRTMCGGKPIDCSSNVGGCKRFIAITANGDVYPCHRFVGRRDFVIGNLLEKSLPDIYADAADLYEKLCELDENCVHCEWLTACGSGCAFERLVANGTFKSMDPECQVKKGLFAYITEKTKHLF